VSNNGFNDILAEAAPHKHTKSIASLRETELDMTIQLLRPFYFKQAINKLLVWLK
jgi:hypothetical protein